MGILRLLLAIAVVLGHVPGCKYVMTGGAVAVQTFYVISGFFIAMVLDLKYPRRDQIGTFYLNRLLRIFSTYWLVLAGVMVLQLGSHHGTFAVWRESVGKIGWMPTALLALSNFIVFGQDWALYIRPVHDGVALSGQYPNGGPSFVDFMFIPPAWSLGIEMTFYLFAPWLLRRSTPVLVSLTALTFILRYGLWLLGYRADPWYYRFFPVELGTFLLGALSYRLIYREIKDIKLPQLTKCVGILILPVIVAYQFIIPKNELFFTAPHLIFYCYAILAVPILFQLSGRNHIDRALGELSFPLYLVHYAVMSTVGHLGIFQSNVTAKTLLILAVSVGVSWVIATYFDASVDRIRQRIAARSQESLSIVGG